MELLIIASENLATFADAQLLLLEDMMEEAGITPGAVFETAKEHAQRAIEEGAGIGAGVGREIAGTVAEGYENVSIKVDKWSRDFMDSMGIDFNW